MKKFLACAALFLIAVSASLKAADIVDTAAADPQFSTLVKAIQTAGLVETLKGAGPFTVFAPTNDAFAKLPAGAMDKLFSDPTKLAEVLKYHVVSGKVMAADVNTMQAASVLGQQLSLEKSDSGVTINGANVTKTDIVCDNGVIHVIDTVLMPKFAKATKATKKTTKKARKS